jgi:hypothetical protein
MVSVPFDGQAALAASSLWLLAGFKISPILRRRDIRKGGETGTSG